MRNVITGDSFGSCCPVNWEDIAAYLNQVIDDRGIADDREAIDELWTAYCRGELTGAPAPIME